MLMSALPQAQFHVSPAVGRGGFIQQSLFDHGRDRFLGEGGSVLGPDERNSPDREKLWLYNLHYLMI